MNEKVKLNSEKNPDGKISWSDVEKPNKEGESSDDAFEREMSAELGIEISDDPEQLSADISRQESSLSETIGATGKMTRSEIAKAAGAIFPDHVGIGEEKIPQASDSYNYTGVDNNTKGLSHKNMTVPVVGGALAVIGSYAAARFGMDPAVMAQIGIGGLATAVFGGPAAMGMTRLLGKHNEKKVREYKEVEDRVEEYYKKDS